MSAIKSHYLNYGFPSLPNHNSPYPSPDIDKIYSENVLRHRTMPIREI